MPLKLNRQGTGALTAAMSLPGSPGSSSVPGSPGRSSSVMLSLPYPPLPPSKVPASPGSAERRSERSASVTTLETLLNCVGSPALAASFSRLIVVLAASTCARLIKMDSGSIASNCCSQAVNSDETCAAEALGIFSSTIRLVCATLSRKLRSSVNGTPDGRSKRLIGITLLP